MGHVKIRWTIFSSSLVYMTVRSKSIHNQEVSETQAPRVNEQRIFSLEGRRLRGNMMAHVKYEQDHYVEGESDTCRLLLGQDYWNLG